MRHDDQRPPRANASQQLIVFGALALILMGIVGANVNGAGGMAGTLVLAAVSILCFVLALRAAQGESK